MKFFNRDWFFHSEPLSGRRKKQDPGLEFSSENENFKPRMDTSRENGSFVCGGMFFWFMRSSENDFFRSLGPLGLRI